MDATETTTHWVVATRFQNKGVEREHRFGPYSSAAYAEEAARTLRADGGYYDIRRIVMCSGPTINLNTITPFSDDFHGLTFVSGGWVQFECAAFPDHEVTAKTNKAGDLIGLRIEPTDRDAPPIAGLTRKWLSQAARYVAEGSRVPIPTEPRRKPHKPGPELDAWLAAVLEVIRAAEGRGQRPVDAVQHEFRLRESSAYQWIKQARE